MRFLKNTFTGVSESKLREKSLDIHSSSTFYNSSNHPSGSENNENNSIWKETSILDSVSKEHKMLNGQVYGTPGKGRTFGEEIDSNNIDNSILDTSQISIETRDTTVSGLTFDDHHSTSDNTSESPSDASLANSNHVASLRGWLNDFGKQNKNHFQKNHVAPPVEALERPHRPKVARSAVVPLVSVPVASKYPYAVSNVAKSSTVETRKVVNPPHHYYSSSLSSQYSKPKTSAHIQPIPPPLSTTAAKSNLIKPFAHDLSNLNGSLKSRAAIRATPIRMKPKIKSEEVQATNEGYASVAKLSAWLADDPTSTKKLKQIRRGANVIAKSRTFDKELVNVIIEKTAPPRGGVSRQREMIEQCKITEENDDDVVSYENKYLTVGLSKSKDWMRLGAPGSDIGISVSDKKKWLNDAFKRNEDNVAIQLKKASTEIVTNRDHYDDASSRAKQLWRSKHSPLRESNNKSRLFSAPNTMTASCEDRQYGRKADKEQVDAFLFTKSTETATTATTQVSMLSFDSLSPIKFTNFSLTENPEDERVPPTDQNQIEEDEASVDFRAARELLVRRSKANGNPVDLSQVQRRKAKFEKMEQESRRRSSSHLKASWETFDDAGNQASSISSTSVHGYVKKYVEDAPPKKSLEQLP